MANLYHSKHTSSTETKKLFCNNKQPIPFYVGEEVRDLKTVSGLVVEHGGTVVHRMRNAAYFIAERGSLEAENILWLFGLTAGDMHSELIVLSPEWIQVCIVNGCLVTWNDWGGCRLRLDPVLQPLNNITPNPPSRCYSPCPSGTRPLTAAHPTFFTAPTPPEELAVKLDPEVDVDKPGTQERTKAIGESNLLREDISQDFECFPEMRAILCTEDPSFVGPARPQNDLHDHRPPSESHLSSVRDVDESHETESIMDPEDHPNGSHLSPSMTEPDYCGNTSLAEVASLVPRANCYVFSYGQQQASSFYLGADLGDREMLSSLVVEHGGVLVPRMRDAMYIILEPKAPGMDSILWLFGQATNLECIILSSRWIYTCLSHGRLVFENDWAGCRIPVETASPPFRYITSEPASRPSISPIENMSKNLPNSTTPAFNIGYHSSNARQSLETGKQLDANWELEVSENTSPTKFASPMTFSPLTFIPPTIRSPPTLQSPTPASVRIHSSPSPSVFSPPAFQPTIPLSSENSCDSLGGGSCRFDVSSLSKPPTPENLKRTAVDSVSIPVVETVRKRPRLAWSHEHNLKLYTYVKSLGLGKPLTEVRDKVQEWYSTLPANELPEDDIIRRLESDTYVRWKKEHEEGLLRYRAIVIV